VSLLARLSFTVESDTVGVHETVGQHTIVGRDRSGRWCRGVDL